MCIRCSFCIHSDTACTLNGASDRSAAFDTCVRYCHYVCKRKVRFTTVVAYIYSSKGRSKNSIRLALPCIFNTDILCVNLSGAFQKCLKCSCSFCIAYHHTDTYPTCFQVVYGNGCNRICSILNRNITITCNSQICCTCLSSGSRITECGYRIRCHTGDSSDRCTENKCLCHGIRCDCLRFACQFSLVHILQKNSKRTALRINLILCRFYCQVTCCYLCISTQKCFLNGRKCCICHRYIRCNASSCCINHYCICLGSAICTDIECIVRSQNSACSAGFRTVHRAIDGNCKVQCDRNASCTTCDHRGDCLGIIRICVCTCMNRNIRCAYSGSLCLNHCHVLALDLSDCYSCAHCY